MISLLVPSRGRPESFSAMMESAKSNASQDMEIVLRLDEDDPRRFDYELSLHMDQVVTKPRAVLSSCWNDCAAIAQGDILMQCADDLRFRTRHWDTLVRDAMRKYPDRIAYVYGRDGIADERMATHGFMHRRWYETLGYFTWPEFSSDYGDLWNHTIAQRLGRLHFIPELHTEHLHPAAGKAEIDQTHRERLERDKTDRNVDRWEAAQPDLGEAVEQLRSVMDVSP